MSNIEGGPFNGIWDKIGRQHNSCDSCVGVLRGTNTVVKWSKARPESRAEMWGMCEFRRRSDILYREALGDEHIVDSIFIAGQKKNGRGMEYKPYIIQPFINSWTGKDVPNEIRNSRIVTDQWAVLYSRLYYLYQTASEVNSQLSDEYRFPVTITVGSTRQIVKENLGQEDVIRMPQTDNILVDKGSKKLYLCDFGEYAVWTVKMTQAYDEILSRTSLRNNNSRD